MTSAPDPGDVRSRLEEMRAAAARRMSSLEASFDDIVRATQDVAVDDEHDPEGHTIAWERQQVAALLDETQVALEHIERAERRLDAGTYGRCTVCGERISAERLEALPATATCVDCAG